MKKVDKDVIYILTNPSFPEYVKIGYASNIERRLKELNRSETVPYAFRVYAIYEVKSKLTDKELHKLIDSLDSDLRAVETFDGKERVKEFYEMSAEKAYSLLECIAKISGTQNRLKRMKPEGHEIKDEKKAAEARENARRGPFNFQKCGIPVGSKILFKDDKKISAIVVDERRVKYKNVITSVSAVAQELKGFDHPVQGTLYFTYNGKILNDIRIEKEGK